MSVVDNIKHELQSRLLPIEAGKKHISVRYEPATRTVRVGACIEDFTWENREAVVEALLEFEESHGDEYGLEFDVVPLEAVTDPQFASA